MLLPPAEASFMRSWGATCSTTQEKGNYGHRFLLSTSRDASTDILALPSNPDDERKTSKHPYTTGRSAKI